MSSSVFSQLKTIINIKYFELCIWNIHWAGYWTDYIKRLSILQKTCNIDNMREMRAALCTEGPRTCLTYSGDQGWTRNTNCFSRFLFCKGKWSSAIHWKGIDPPKYFHWVGFSIRSSFCRFNICVRLLCQCKYRATALSQMGTNKSVCILYSLR